MKVRKRGRQITRRLLTSLLGVAACLAVTVPPAFSEDAAPVPSGQTPAGSGVNAPQPPTAASEGGMKIYIDPRTGALLKEPAPGSVPLQLSPREQNALSTSHEGLVEVPSTVPGGGVALDLQGRFQSPLIGTVDENGKVRMQHLGEPAEPDHKH